MLRLGTLVALSALVALPGCEEVGPDADCFERSEDEEFGNPHISNHCEWESPCESLSLECPGSDEAVDCGPEDARVQNPDALTCILDALAEGERGAYSWSSTAAEDRGWASRQRRLWSRGGTAYFASSHRIDLGDDKRLCHGSCWCRYNVDRV